MLGQGTCWKLESPIMFLMSTLSDIAVVWLPPRLRLATESAVWSQVPGVPHREPDCCVSYDRPSEDSPGILDVH